MPSEIFILNEHFSHAPMFIKLVHFNCIEKDLYFAIKVKLHILNIYIYKINHKPVKYSLLEDVQVFQSGSHLLYCLHASLKIPLPKKMSDLLLCY